MTKRGSAVNDRQHGAVESRLPDRRCEPRDAVLRRRGNNRVHIPPPLWFAGRTPTRSVGATLDLFDSDPGVEAEDVAIAGSGEVAFIHGLLHLASTVQGNSRRGPWYRSRC